MNACCSIAQFTKQKAITTNEHGSRSQHGYTIHTSLTHSLTHSQQCKRRQGVTAPHQHMFASHTSQHRFSAAGKQSHHHHHSAPTSCRLPLSPKPCCYHAKQQPYTTQSIYIYIYCCRQQHSNVTAKGWICIFPAHIQRRTQSLARLGALVKETAEAGPWLLATTKECWVLDGKRCKTSYRRGAQKRLMNGMDVMSLWLF